MQKKVLQIDIYCHWDLYQFSWKNEEEKKNNVFFIIFTKLKYK